MSIAYGDHPQQVLDVYESPSASPLGTAVLFHGGGWARGDKDRPFGTLALQHFKDVLVKANLRVILPNYRLAADSGAPPQHPYDTRYPGAHQDAERVEDYVRMAYPGPFVVGGESAGGLLATHLAFRPGATAAGLFIQGGVTAPAGLPPGGTIEKVAWYAGFGSSSDKGFDPRGMSPLTMLDPIRPCPVLAWMGELDDAVPLSQAATAVALGNGPSILRVVQGAGHTGPEWTSSDLLDWELAAWVSARILEAVLEVHVDLMAF